MQEQAAALADSPSGFGVDPRVSSITAAGYKANDFLLPVNYVQRLSAQDSLELNLPISLTDIEGGKSYSASAGLLWRHRITPNWTLQPSARIGGVGAVDLATVSGFWSVGLTSAANFDLPSKWKFTVANTVSYFSTIPITIGRLSLDYNVSNVVFRNGFLFSHDLGFRVRNLPIRGTLFAADTRYAGNAVTIRSFQEFGVFVSAGSLAPARLGATYLTGDRGVRGFMVNTGFRF